MYRKSFFTGSASARRYPLSLVYSGDYQWHNGAINAQNTYGFWWSNTAISNDGSYGLNVGSSALYPQGNDGQAVGLVLR